MNGAEALVRTFVNAGLEVCFTNPGTSELHFVAALSREQGMRPILGLFEGVVSGAADGYARMADKPAVTLLHLGPGLANGLANFHNARKARTPIVNLVGEHATPHRPYDAPLTSDVEAFARPVSGWVQTANDPKTVARDGAQAVAAAYGPPGQVASLIVPADVAWTEAVDPADPLPIPTAEEASPEAVTDTAIALRSGESTVILMSGRALRRGPLEVAGRIAASTGARLFCDTFNARWERGAGIPTLDPLPYFAEGALAALDGVRHLILVGTQAPVAFFAYPGKPSSLTPEACQVQTLASPAEDCEAALEALADALGASQAAPRAERNVASAPAGPLSPASIARSVAALLPEGAVVSEEAITASASLTPGTRGAPPHDWLALTGGAIGQGIPVATGAAVACPDRKVVCLQADGSAMYTIQGLWTQSREGLDVTTVILANRSYAILQIELQRVGALETGPDVQQMLRIDDPVLDLSRISQGLGVPATRVTTADEFHEQFARSMAEPGPSLIEAVY